MFSFLSSSCLWWQSIARTLTLSLPRAPRLSTRPRQGSRPLRFCGLQTPHPRGRSGQKPQLWGIRLGEGTSVSRFPPAGSRLLSGCAPGFETSHVWKSEDVPCVHRVPRPFPDPASCCSGRDPVADRDSGACFPAMPAQHCFLTTIERNLHGLGGMYFGSLRAAEQSTKK